MAVSETTICNRALQLLGAKRISDIAEDSKNARACDNCYETIRDAVLSDHPWNFAIQRHSLAADADEPEWGRANSFTLPAGCLKPLPPYPEDNFVERDWVVENGKILTDEDAPLYLRAVMQITEVGQMHPLFVEYLAHEMALAMCEELTQSNSKKEALRTARNEILSRARRANAIENVPIDAPTDSWITGRS